MDETTHMSGPKPGTKREKVLRLAKARGVLRISDMTDLGVTRSYVENLVEQGDLERIGRGLFQSPDFAFTEHHTLVEVLTHAPKVVICLLSALQFHELTTQLPPHVWVAIPNLRAAPKVPTVGIEAIHMNERWLRLGVDRHLVEGVQVPIFSVAKTIADCFKYRDRVGTAVAIEALRDSLRKRKTTHAEIYDVVKDERRLWDRMRPYLEAVS